MKNGLIVFENGIKRYYLNDLYHRVDGPAIEFADGSEEWYLYGKLHREDGPAMQSLKGAYFKRDIIEWYLNDERIDCKTQEEFERLMKLKAFF